MNQDHLADSVSIVRAHGAPAATSARMIALDGAGGTWEATSARGTETVRIEWSQPITERAEIRREIVRLHAAMSPESGV